MEYQPDPKNMRGTGGEVVAVVPGSTAAALGMRVGDRVVAINGLPMRDVIDYRYAVAEERVAVDVLRGELALRFEAAKDVDDDLGLEFSEPLWDRLRTCNNKCPFCFLTQMPKGFSQNPVSQGRRLPFVVLVRQLRHAHQP